MTQDTPVPCKLLNRVFVLSVLFSMIMFFLACSLAAERSVWIDEATYLSNLHQNWQCYFKPLPFYDQGSPPLVSLLYSAIIQLVSNNVYLLRLCILSISCLALAYFGQQVLQVYGIPLAMSTMLFLMGDGLVVRYVTEVKQYAFELAASLVLVGYYLHLMRSDRCGTRTGVSFFVFLSLILTFFSYGAALVAAVLMFDAGFFCGKGNDAQSWKRAFVVFLGLYSVLYAFYFRALVFIQFNNYHQVYQAKMLKDNFDSLAFWKGFAFALSGLFVSKTLLIPCGLVSVVVVILTCKKFATDNFAPARLTLLLCGAIVALSSCGLYPLSHTRQFFFSLPLLALLIGWSVQQLLDRRRAWSFVTVILIVVLLLASGVKNDCDAFAGKYDFQRTKNLYEFVVTGGYRHVLVECFLQPCIEFYARDGRLAGKIFLGKLDSTTRVLPRHFTVSDNYPNVFEGAGGWQAMIPIGSYGQKLRYELYTDWLISKTPDNQAVLLVTNGSEKTMPQTWGPLMHSIERRGCDSEVVFADSGVRALRLDCPGSLKNNSR